MPWPRSFGGWRAFFWSLILSLSGFLAAPPAARASGELRELYRGARATAMGGAFVGIADDEQALFINPAGLAGIENYTLRYMDFFLEMPSDILGTVSTLTSLQGVTGDSLNGIMGKNVYTRFQVTPSFVMPNFGIGIIVDQQLALYAKNIALPNITVGYQTTNGIQAGYGFSLLRNSRRRRSSDDLRLGFGAKILWRRGGYRPLSLSQIFTPSAEMFQSVVGDFGRGFGVDAGLQFIKRFGNNFTWSLGTAMTEIGGVSFDSGADPQKENLSAGTAFKFELTRPKTSVTLAYDYRHILDTTDWHLHHHLGLEIGLPMLKIFGGLNQFYPTFGATFNAWLLKITALSYREELSSVYKLDTQSRYLLKLEFSLNI